MHQSSSFRIEVEPQGDTAIVRLVGKLTIGAGEVALRDTVSELVAKGFKNVILVLSGLSTIDSSGIGELVSAYTSVTSSKGHIILVDPPFKIRDILENVVHLDTVFDIYDSLDDALAHLRS